MRDTDLVPHIAQGYASIGTARNPTLAIAPAGPLPPVHQPRQSEPPQMDGSYLAPPPPSDRPELMGGKQR